MTDIQINDFSNQIFQTAFKQYFQELGIAISDWDGLFQEMNKQKATTAILRLNDNEECIGFIQVEPIVFTSWFFEETCGFIRELWIAPKHRHSGHGSKLVSLAEAYFSANGIHKSILTTDSAPEFYKKLGYEESFGCKAKNNDPVYIKKLN